MPYIGQSPATGEANSFKILDNISSYTLTFDGSGADVVSVDNDTITEREHRFVTGQRVTYNDGGGTAITGLSDGVYYIIVEDRHTFKLASSANNAAAGTAINLTGLGVGASHTLNVAFDGVNTKFKATHTNGNRADISQSAQLMVSINGVLQQPHDNTDSPPTGYATDHTSTIIFSSAPDIGDEFFGRLIAENFATFDISDNVVDNFTGDGSTSTFTLSKSPPNNESILVTIDGIVQYPDDNAAVRAYTVSENTLDFISAPGDGVEIQVRHIGFAGASTGGVSGFYGRTGNAALRSTDDIIFNNATASGTVQAANVTVTGDLTVNGTTTTLDTDLIGVDKLEVSANNTTVAAAITQTGTGDILNLYDGAAQVVTVTDGGNVGIGSESPVEKLVVAGDARITGILTVGSSSLTLDGTNDIVNVGTALTLSHTQGIQFYNQSLHSQGLDVNNINVTGIVTATTFSGAVTGTASDASGSTGDFSIADKIVHTGDTDTKIRFPAADTVTVETADVERLRITSGGAVQVNGGAVHLDASGELAVFETDTNLTFTNSSKLAFDFSGNVARIRTSFNGSASVRPLAFYTGNDERLRISSAGLVGIGLTDPDLRLHVSGSNGLPATSGSTPTGHISVRAKGTGASHGFHMGVSNAAPWSSWIQAQDANGLATNYPLLLNPNGGNVGIGTDNPDGKLDVRGTIFVNGDATGGRIFASGGNLSLTDGNGRQTLRIDDPGAGNTHTHVFDSSGNVGINTTSPRQAFDVQGKIVSSESGNYDLMGAVGYTDPTIIYYGDGKGLDVIPSTNVYCGVRTKSAKYKYVRIEADIKTTTGDHWGLYWHADQTNLGYNTGVSGYKIVYRDNSNRPEFRDINTNSNILNMDALTFAYNDGVYHRWVVEVLSTGVSVFVDGELKGQLNSSYSIGQGYCGFHAFSIGDTVSFRNATITSLDSRDSKQTIYTSTKQLDGYPAGVYKLKNSSGMVQEVFVDDGWMLITSNNAEDNVIPNNRNNIAYTVNRNGVNASLGVASPNADYIIGGFIDDFSFSKIRIIGWGYDNITGSYDWSNYTSSAYVTAEWSATSLTTVVATASVTKTGSLSSSINYFVGDGVRADYNDGGTINANINQTTIGGVGVAAASGSPSSGCYLGHGTGESSNFCEGWYNSGNAARDAQGYTTWVRT